MWLHHVAGRGTRLGSAPWAPIDAGTGLRYDGNSKVRGGYYAYVFHVLDGPLVGCCVLFDSMTAHSLGPFLELYPEIEPTGDKWVSMSRTDAIADIEGRSEPQVPT
jgi:hypothetical protein